MISIFTTLWAKTKGPKALSVGANAPTYRAKWPYIRPILTYTLGPAGLVVRLIRPNI